MNESDHQAVTPRPPGAAPSAQSPAPVARPFSFHGDGSEFFRIWIVNLALTIVTLGIYSAWAKVRTNRYFYGNTELAGDRFEYLADPIVILKGRLLAVAALVLYSIAQYFSPVATLLLMAVFLVLIPFVVVRAFRFRALMTSWRGVRFGFEGTPGEAAKAYLLWPLAGMLSLGLAVPYAWYKQNLFAINNHRFGTSRAASTASASDFYVIMLVMVGVSVIGIIGFVMLGLAGTALSMSGGEDAEPGVGLIVSMTLGYALIYLLLFVAYQAMHFKVVYDNIDIQGNKVRNTVSVMRWFGIVLVNTLLMLLTLGLYYPWARVRLTTYMLENLRVDAVDLDSFIAHAQDAENAMGEEFGEAFDLGIGV